MDLAIKKSPMICTIANVKVAFLCLTPQTPEEIAGCNLDERQRDSQALTKELVMGLVILTTGLD